tara:strand:+ start:72172 stop:73434 length:1263 start_codon:yes stop_codon:yes gene_type:complete
MSTKSKIHIHWFGNDLRVTDQPFAEKANEADEMIGVYIIDPKRIERNEWGFRNMSLNRLKALREHLVDLESNLAKKGIPLIVKYGDPFNVLSELIEKHEASISFMKESATHERSSQEKVLQHFGSHVHAYDGNYLFHPSNIDWGDDFPHSFSKFRKKAEKFLKKYEYNLFPELKEFSPVLKPQLKNSKREIHEDSALPFRGGERSGKERLQYYLFDSKNASQYKNTRNGLLGKDYSTKFSFWLAVGALSPFMIMKELREYEKQEGSNKSTYWIFFELLWRDFFRHAGKFYKDEFFGKNGVQENDWDYQESEIAFDEWANGNTLKDFVNANMIELAETGFMSNRGRQNAASYLVHDQNQDWRRGAAWFEHHLLDFDVYSNHGNWQYVTGVSFNPKGGSKFGIDFQAERYDKKKKFRETWLK